MIRLISTPNQVQQTTVPLIKGQKNNVISNNENDNSNTNKGTTKNKSYNKEPVIVHTKQDETYNEDKPNTDTGNTNITIPSNKKEIESTNTKSKIS